MKTITITLTVPDGVDVQVAQGGPVAQSTTYEGQEPPRAVVGAPAPHTCAHGPRIHKNGTNKAGKPYEGYFCPEDLCSPEWVSTR